MGFEAMMNMGETVTIVDEYDAISGTYEKHRSSYMRTTSHYIIDSFAEECSPVNILEIGVGTGFLAQKVLNRFPAASYTGIDISPGMLHQARIRLDGYGPRVSLIEGDFLQQQFGTQQFDCIVTNSVLHFMDTPLAVKKVATLMASGGVFIGVDFCNELWFPVVDFAIRKLRKSGNKALHRDAFVKVATDEGFQVEKLDRFTKGIFVLQGRVMRV